MQVSRGFPKHFDYNFLLHNNACKKLIKTPQKAFHTIKLVWWQHKTRWKKCSISSCNVFLILKSYN